MVQITALMDNQPSEHKGLINEHGLSYLVRRKDCRLLFDCGAGDHPWHNARRLGLSLSGLDAVVLSHSHYDHSAGYRDLLAYGGGGGPLYTGPHFFEPKFAKNGMKYTDLSAGFDPSLLEEHGVVHREVTDVTEIFPGIYLLAGFPRVHPFETIPDRFVRLTPGGFRSDDFSDEICMAIDMGGKLAVLVGCSHPGILNMVTKVHDALDMPVWAVFGGTHLVEADSARVQTTVASLKAMGLSVLGMSHCSGEEAECAIGRDSHISSCHMAVGDSVFLD